MTPETEVAVGVFVAFQFRVDFQDAPSGEITACDQLNIVLDAAIGNNSTNTNTDSTRGE